MDQNLSHIRVAAGFKEITNYQRTISGEEMQQ